MSRRIALLMLTAFGTATALAAESAADRGGRKLTQNCYIPAIWSRAAYGNAWKRWEGVTEKPADYDQRFRDVYGLHPAPYPNNGLPMGLREGTRLLAKGLAVDCLACHGGSIFGQSHVGLGNSSVDVEALFSDLSAADGLPGRLPFTFSHVRGTSEAGTMSVYLLGKRNPDLTFSAKSQNLGIHDDQIEDVPAWWLLKKKATMYHSGGADARSVRSIMQFMMGSLLGPDAFAKAEPDFADILQHMLTLEPPKYSLPVDRTLAAQGEALFDQHCVRCHGTYGADATYPNKIVPLQEIGTDPKRYQGIRQQFSQYYNRSWFAQAEQGDGPAYPAKDTNGYQAPPLDGLWATAPYLHNGSAPTVYHVLNSKARPRRFTRSYQTAVEDYDPVRLGWKFTEVGPVDPKLPGRERRKVYDTAQPGRGNRGHIYGDKLSDPERWAVIEYLKTL